MGIITISRGSYSYGKEIAEKVATRLGYGCISREVLLEASKDFNIPEFKLFHAVADAPSVLERILYTKDKYIAYIQAGVLKCLKKDNVVYHGFAGHFFVKDVSHVLKVRIIANLDTRISLVMERDGVSREEAIDAIHKVDEDRKKWSEQLYGIDARDPVLYDLVIHIDKLTVGNAVDIICQNAGLEQFQTTPESQQQMEDLFLAAEVKAALIKLKPDIEVTAHQGSVLVWTKAPVYKESKLIQDMKRIGQNVPGVKEVHIDMLPISPYAID
ncbi:MAG: cytidylate kinase-like family protein [Deltaproteobacteria bacterium]|nr:cytidylate kinase-like family protein [Deltaproteobacteria bacterium]MBW1993177.1 cytidylate kinase-like family protein [Deltaproteobacteria bacterium]MBW2153179.1 cytidylate kinase-like family protein [Deltaproteobacteria bacterium]